MSLTAGEIAEMRDTVQTETLAGTAVIGRYISTSDGEGGETRNYVNFGTAACHVSPISGDEAQIAAGVASEAQWVITLPAGTDLDERDRVVIDTVTYEVDAVRTPRTWELACRVYAHTTS